MHDQTVVGISIIALTVRQRDFEIWMRKCQGHCVNGSSSRVSNICLQTTTANTANNHTSDQSNFTKDAHISKHHHLPHLAIRHPDHPRIRAADDAQRSILKRTDARQPRSITSLSVHPDLPILAILALVQHLAASSTEAALLLQALSQRQLGRELGLWRRR